MRRIGHHRGRDYFLHVMHPGEDFPDPFAGTPYPALVWATVPVRDEDRHRIAAALVATHCRYAVCGGVDCEMWHDAVDWAAIEQDLLAEEPEAPPIMTTWHQDESEDDVAHFFAHATTAGAHEFGSCLVLLIGPDEQTEKLLAERVTAHAREA